MKRTALVITGLAALLLLLLPYTLGPYAMHVADVTVLFALLAIGLGLAMGIAGRSIWPRSRSSASAPTPSRS